MRLFVSVGATSNFDISTPCTRSAARPKGQEIRPGAAQQMGQADCGTSSCSITDDRLYGSRDACSSGMCCSPNSSAVQGADQHYQTRSRIPQGRGCQGSRSVENRRRIRRGWIGFGLLDQLTRTGLTCILLLSILAGSGVVAQPGDAVRGLADGAPAPMQVSC